MTERGTRPGQDSRMGEGLPLAAARAYGTAVAIAWEQLASQGWLRDQTRAGQASPSTAPTT
jgi:hypothetical protein